MSTLPQTHTHIHTGRPAESLSIDNHCQLGSLVLPQLKPGEPLTRPTLPVPPVTFSTHADTLLSGVYVLASRGPPPHVVWLAGWRVQSGGWPVWTVWKDSRGNVRNLFVENTPIFFRKTLPFPLDCAGVWFTRNQGVL